MLLYGSAYVSQLRYWSKKPWLNFEAASAKALLTQVPKGCDWNWYTSKSTKIHQNPVYHNSAPKVSTNSSSPFLNSPTLLRQLTSLPALGVPRREENLLEDGRNTMQSIGAPAIPTAGHIFSTSKRQVIDVIYFQVYIIYLICNTDVCVYTYTYVCIYILYIYIYSCVYMYVYVYM